MKQFCESLAKQGNVTRAAEAAGVTRVWVYRVRAKNERFAKAWQNAEERYTDRIGGAAERAAIRRGVKGWEEKVYQSGECVGTRTRFSDTLLVKVLEANNPKYAKTATLQVTGGTTSTVAVTHTHELGVSAVDLEQVRQMLAAAQGEVIVVPLEGK